MPIPPLNNFDQVRKQIAVTRDQIQAVADKLERLSLAKDDLDQSIASNLVDFGVRIGRITEHVAGTTDIETVSHGYAQLVNTSDYSADDKIVPAYNITEKEYTVGTLVALLPVQNSFFVASDPGLFAAEILPVISIVLPPGDTFFEWNAGEENSLINSPVPRFHLSDALPESTANVDSYSLELRCINGVFSFDPGDSGVGIAVVNSSDVFLTGTIDSLNSMLVGNTTATLTVHPVVPGADTLIAVLYDNERTRQSLTYITGTLAIGSSGFSTDIQVFTSDGTWNKPTGAVSCHIACIGGGGSGASGRKGAAGSNRGGGGGGEGGRFSELHIDAALISDPVTVTIGAGNTSPGAAVSTNTTNGNPGNAGTATTFGSYVRALGGLGGVGGTDLQAGGTQSAEGTGTNNFEGTPSGSTFAGVNTGNPDSKYGGAAGGAGGSFSGATSLAGIAGGIGARYSMNTGAAGGTAGTAVGGNGGNGTAATANFPRGGGGGAGGGAGANAAATNGGTGGNGALYGAGGGGGGAGTNAQNNSGAGGNGANGICVVITYCE